MGDHEPWSRMDEGAEQPVEHSQDRLPLGLGGTGRTLPWTVRAQPTAVLEKCPALELPVVDFVEPRVHDHGHAAPEEEPRGLRSAVELADDAGRDAVHRKCRSG